MVVRSPIPPPTSKELKGMSLTPITLRSVGIALPVGGGSNEELLRYYVPGLTASQGREIAGLIDSQSRGGV